MRTLVFFCPLFLFYHVLRTGSSCYKSDRNRLYLGIICNLSFVAAEVGARSRVLLSRSRVATYQHPRFFTHPAIRELSNHGPCTNPRRIGLSDLSRSLIPKCRVFIVGIVARIRSDTRGESFLCRKFPRNKHPYSGVMSPYPVLKPFN